MNKVGRPKLADTNLKKESISMVGLCMVMITMLISLAFKTTDTSLLMGSLNKSPCKVSSYKVNASSIKIIMKCNNTIESAKLASTNLIKTDDGFYGFKYIPLDGNKKINYSWVIKGINKRITRSYVVDKK